jgi:chemotaxis receptor (MCP) glutamine deamidase CheD
MQDIQVSNSATPLKYRTSVQPPVLPLVNEKCQILVKKGFLTARNVTTGVALIVYSSEFQLGVLLHLPPLCTPDLADLNFQGDAFAKTALTMILAEFESLGVAKSDLLIYAIGGSAADGMPAVSKAAARRALSRYGLGLSACDLGGHQMRSVWLDVQSGRTIIRSGPISMGGAQSESPLSVAS